MHGEGSEKEGGVTEAFIDGVVAGYGIAIPVGAVAILIVGAAMRGGFGYGFSAGAGAATADLLYALVAALAGAVVADWLEPWSRPIRLVSATVLVAIAVWGLLGIRRRATGSPPTLEVTRSDLVSAYARFVGITIINPLTVVYFTTLVLGSGLGRDRGVVALVLFAAGAFLASLSWQTLLAAIGAFGRRGLSPKAQVVTLVIGNVVILVLALRIAVGA
ncbi:MAG TPA: LysE family transporter [Acidimicrobiia bacterium]|jgi:arginine exporter protein ArgO